MSLEGHQLVPEHLVGSRAVLEAEACLCGVIGVNLHGDVELLPDLDLVGQFDFLDEHLIVGRGLEGPVVDLDT
jgi:hypothetical protein